MKLVENAKVREHEFKSRILANHANAREIRNQESEINQDQPAAVVRRMELSIQTPALLFPAISLLMLSYTNRFLAISALIRKLSADFEASEHLGLLSQIKNLRRRVYLIRWAQFFAIISMLGCTLTMFLVYERLPSPATIVFAGSLLLMMISLLLCLWEIFVSADALRLVLNDLEEKERTLKK